MISFNQLAMAYGGKLLFNDVELKLTGQTRYVLVGANGTGKSTLMRLMNGEETPMMGSISLPKNLSIGWLKQDQFRYEETLIVEVVLQGKKALWDALKQKEELLKSEHWDEATANRLSHLEEIINHYNGYTAEALAEKILVGLGIDQNYLYEPLKTLSGGYKLRVLLAQTLFQEPDILLLDEPTNHLDIVSIDWLENYLKNTFKGLLLLISHDVNFINGLADYILDIDYGEIRQYSGNYQKFLEEKRLIEEQKLHEKKNIEDKIAQLQSFVDRFGAKASKAKQAQSKAKQIEKLELPDIKKSSRIAPNFEFKINRQPGKRVLTVKGISKKFEYKTIFENVSFNLDRGEKLAIIGANGIGKSTLLKTILGQIPADQGEAEWGHETYISYFSQTHHELLNEHLTLADWMQKHSENTTMQQQFNALGRVMLAKEAMQKDILTLSGGEAARVLLAKIMLEQTNVLVFDEPTNHMDIETIDALAEALNRYPGTLILVSHDRAFISKIASRIIYIPQSKKLIDFHGKYEEFVKEHPLIS